MIAATDQELRNSGNFSLLTQARNGDIDVTVWWDRYEDRVLLRVNGLDIRDLVLPQGRDIQTLNEIAWSVHWAVYYTKAEQVSPKVFGIPVSHK